MTFLREAIVSELLHHIINRIHFEIRKWNSDWSWNTQNRFRFPWSPCQVLRYKGIQFLTFSSFIFIYYNYCTFDISVGINIYVMFIVINSVELCPIFCVSQVFKLINVKYNKIVCALQYFQWYRVLGRRCVCGWPSSTPTTFQFYGLHALWEWPWCIVFMHLSPCKYAMEKLFMIH